MECLAQLVLSDGESTVANYSVVKLTPMAKINLLGMQVPVHMQIAGFMLYADYHEYERSCLYNQEADREAVRPYGAVIVQNDIFAEGSRATPDVTGLCGVCQ